MVYFHIKNLNLGKTLERLAMKDFMVICPILLQFGIFYGDLVNFFRLFGIVFPFWFVVARKIWQPCKEPGLQ
jgi:hypothetical protein